MKPIDELDIKKLTASLSTGVYPKTKDGKMTAGLDGVVEMIMSALSIQAQAEENDWFCENCGYPLAPNTMQLEDDDGNELAVGELLICVKCGEGYKRDNV